MEKAVVEVLGLIFRMIVRNRAKNEGVVCENLIDLEEFAQQSGLSIWDAKKFNRSMDEFIDFIAEDFIKQTASEIKEDERKKAILNQIRSDVEKLNLQTDTLNVALSSVEELRKSIMNQSDQERKSWDEMEVGLYTNCVRYIAKASIDFALKLPGFTSEALKAIIVRQEQYHNELSDILKDIHSMTNLIKSLEVTYREYEGVYRDNLIEKYSKVELIGSGFKERNITRYDISSAYVELNGTTGNYYDEIELSQVFSRKNVVWIKGEAGSGKTTFLQWVAVCAAKNEYQKIKNIRYTIPIVIGLRNAEWPLNLQSAVNKITATYGITCPDGWIADLLKKNRVILLFDGLDEISVTKRGETYSFIEDIVKKYPKMKILLTSRNSVNDSFACDNITYEIVPMKMENIKKFILYWHKSVLWRGAVVGDEEINRLQHKLIMKIVENQPLKALAKNPLLCAMICALNFVNKEQLPNDKMELYDKCCEMLMDSRDMQRQIDSSIYDNIPKLDYSRKRKILEEMAFWMLNGGESLEEKKNVIGFLENLIKETNILPDKNKECNTESILNFFIERSGIIREPEMGKVDFIHKTFMEFLAVKAICRKCAWSTLIKEACNANWKETIMMCFQEMGQETVEYVLNKMILEGGIKKDNRYILMASLGASNAMFLSNKSIKEKIDSEIRAMIPPKQAEVYEIAQAGTYLLPFLKDSQTFSDSDKLRCLNLLSYLETEETIPDLLTYISGCGGEEVKNYALEILSKFGESALEEYNVREELLESIYSAATEEMLITYETMLNMLNKEVVSDERKNLLNNISSLKIVGGVDNDGLYMGYTEFLYYLNDCRKVILTGNISSLYLLEPFSQIEDLTIDACDDLSDALQELSSYKNLASVRHLCIRAEILNFICENDFRVMKELECIEIYCHYPELEVDFTGFKSFSKLKKVRLYVDEFIAMDINREMEKWKKDNLTCEFRCEGNNSFFS